jgi:DNA mismatch endonuclease, patch repair protein
MLSRSDIMARIKNKDTTPELAVRRLIHSLGYRFTLHSKQLPGHADLVFNTKKKVIFVHGCFWHRHSCKRGCSMPKTNVEFWRRKFTRNRQQDKYVRAKLSKLGWKSLVIWECECKAKMIARLTEKVTHFLGP